MVATGGTHWTVRAALLLAAGSVAAGLAGCAYAADDVGPPTAGPSAHSDTPLPTRDPELVAAQTRNLLEVQALLGGPPDRLLIGGSGGLGDSGGGGLSTSGIVTRAGQYKVTAACVGAPDAHLSVHQSPRQGSIQGGTLLERSLDCGDVAEALVDLVPGTVSANLIREGDGGPGSGGPGSVAAAAVWVSFLEPGP
ncbi:MAG: hypothetical protein U1D68_00470 [Arthrobacter sp.]|nr:hypothetical protein [Arthrobacter sp.]MDZ4351196.1 hypothetical protein [Arthrobacter sp.]